MTIQLSFNNLEEYEAGILQLAAAFKTQKAPEEKNAALKQQPDPEPSEEKPAEREKPSEDLRVEVRRLLAALNKKTGTNTAKGLIAEFGVDSFKQVALEDLPALKEKVKEAMDAK